MGVWRATLGFRLTEPLDPDRQLALLRTLARQDATAVVDGVELSVTLCQSAAKVGTLESAVRLARYRTLHALHSAGLAVAEETSLALQKVQDAVPSVPLSA